MSDSALFLGLDIGSTTVKGVVLDAADSLLFSRYQRHFSEVRTTLANILSELLERFPCRVWHIAVTGSGAISLAEELGLAFVQEVIAASLAIRSRIPGADVAIELGGEDAKITFFSGGVERRMNETCAGGTGAFIDQMASFLGTDAAGLNDLAVRHSTIYPIASRCGVFAKTDVLPLLNEGCAREDIAASILQAVVDQTISGLAWGRSIKGRVVFLGGPLAFLPSLRERFVQTLHLGPDAAVFPEHAEYFVALGAAAYAKTTAADAYTDASSVSGTGGGVTEEALSALLKRMRLAAAGGETRHMEPLFADEEAWREFSKRHARESAGRMPLEEHSGDAWLGIDSGSTTLKAALIDAEGRILYSFYSGHGGDPLPAALAVLKDLYARKNDAVRIRAVTVTGYGSGLLKAALGADIDEVETVAHFMGARFFQPDVSYILDIGGQDIKCLRIRNGAIDRIQLNEACSAGCGSFIETFAKSLDMPLANFVDSALHATAPVDLGTRCTVFMNSRVKQAQKDGAGVGDIAAGLSYSVIRNACYKVIKIANPEELGRHVVAQGGSFLNDALLRALELTLGREVTRPDIAGLMGAFGAALIAKERGAPGDTSTLISRERVAGFRVETGTARCARCSNRCLLTISRFGDGTRFISGNRCEAGLGGDKGGTGLPNLYAEKYERLFSYTPLERDAAPRGVIGIPRTLNIFENYPLWFTLFTELGFRVELSDASSKETFQRGYNTIPSQTVCYPAKLAHGHMYDLLDRDVDAIFFPCLPFEKKEFKTQNNHYNCPVVIGYPELLANNLPELREKNIAYIYSFLPLEEDLLPRRLRDIPFFSGLPLAELEGAVKKGFAEQERYKEAMRRAGEKALEELAARGAYGIVLAGHPYHVDPEIHHGIAEVINSCGMGVLTADSVAHMMPDPGPLRVVDQWTYHARLYRAGAFAAGTDNLAILQLVSFGCGLDAITSDQLEEILMVKGRLYAQIKIDEGANLGPARIRIRSLLAALRERTEQQEREERGNGEESGGNSAPVSMPVFTGSPPFTHAMRESHTILIPQLSPIHFQFLETIFAAEGYRTLQLPEVSREALETGLRYVHNDACYPAIVVVGQLLHAVRSGKFDTDKIALMISQTGGGCRATNYIAFLRKALVSCGLEHIPIVSFNVGGMDKNPGFHLTGSLLRRVLMAGFYGDTLMRMIHRVRPYEAEAGSAARLADYWVGKLKQVLREGRKLGFHIDMFSMIRDFDTLPLVTEERKPQVGLVGEILLKYHPDANNRAAEIVEAEGGEAVMTDLMDFVLYSFYDEVFRYRYLSGSWKNYAIGISSIAFIEYCRWSMRWGLSRSKRFTAPLSFRKLRQKAGSLISLGHQAGEGWLLAAEMVEMLETGCDNILCMQPFGCLPNHITGKGLLNELKRRYPKANIAAVDYDPGASEVNQINRIKLMMSCIKG